MDLSLTIRTKRRCTALVLPAELMHQIKMHTTALGLQHPFLIKSYVIITYCFPFLFSPPILFHYFTPFFLEHALYRRLHANQNAYLSSLPSLLYSYLQHIYSTRTYNTVASSELESFPLEDDRFCHCFRITSVCKSRCQRSVPENAKLEFGA